MDKEINKNNEEKIKWTKPELVLNNVNDTEGKDFGGAEFNTIQGPS